MSNDKQPPPYQPEKLFEYGLNLPSNQIRANLVRQPKTNAELFNLVTEKHALIGNGELKAEDLYFFRVVASNQRLDSYFTKMADSSLKNYAVDAEEGVAFLNSHRHRELALGKTITGELDTEGETDVQYEQGDLPRVLTDVYTVRGLQLGEVSTDNFIRGVEVGIIKDTSIGFKEGFGFQYTCSVCGMDLWDWDCPHIPGVEYDRVPNPQNSPDRQQSEKVLCFAWVENARLSELSAVADGATPNSMIVKAQREIRAGRMTAQTQRFLETKYRFSPESRVWIKGEQQPANANSNGDERDTRNPNHKESKPMSETNDKPRNDDTAVELGQLKTQINGVTTFVRETCQKLGLKLEENTSTTDAVAALRGEIERLQPLAKDGEAYRKALVNEAVAEGVRANGDKFDEENQRKMLENLDVEVIKQMRNSWQMVGDSRFGQGRQSTNESDADKTDADNQTDDTKTNNDSSVSRLIPTSAYGRL